VARVAGETDESRAKRRQLTNQLDVLVQGLETCKKFVVWTLHGMLPIYSSMRYHDLAVRSNAWRTGTREEAILPERSLASSPDLSSLAPRKGTDELVTKEDLEVSEISCDEVQDDSSFSEALPPMPELEQEPLFEVDQPAEAIAEPIDEDWGRVLTPASSAKKSKKAKKGLYST
jgi:hypothetical protein